MRKEELEKSLDALGVKEYEWLGYKDSGMMGTEENNDPDCFWRQDYFGPVGKLVTEIRKYKPDVLITYDPFGGYGHPDHIQTHRVGTAAFFAAGDVDKFPLKDGEEVWIPERLYFNAWSKSRIQARRTQMYEAGILTEDEFNAFNPIGSDNEDIDVEIDGTKYIEHKINSMKAHRSQFKDDWWGFNIPVEFQKDFLGFENYILAFNRGEWSSPSELI